MRKELIRERLYTIIFEHDTPAGRAFDITLIVVILLSVLLVMLDSVVEMRMQYGEAFRIAEWFFTILFTMEYALRLWCSRDARGYALSFYGVVDLVAFLPTYLAVLIPASRFFTVVRILRVLRIFRVLKLVHYITEGAVLSRALKASRYKIAVFLVAVLTSVAVVGSLMYLIEGSESGFTSIPQSIYWAIVTITTVGYGDIAPNDAARQVARSSSDDHGVRHYRRAYRNRDAGNRSRRARAGGHDACMYVVRPCRT